jgi:hypothetical protein
MKRTKSQYRRLLQVLNLISRGGVPADNLPALGSGSSRGALANCSTIAWELEVHPKTIYRDVEALRDEFGAPIEYDPRRYGYYLTRPAFTIPGGMMTSEDVCCLAIVEAMLRDSGLQALGEKLASFIDRATSSSDAAVRSMRDAMSRLCSSGEVTGPSVPEKVLRAIASGALRNRLILVFLRQAARDGDTHRGIRMAPSRLKLAGIHPLLSGVVYPDNSAPYPWEVPLSDVESVSVLPSAPPPAVQAMDPAVEVRAGSVPMGPQVMHNLGHAA